MSGFAIQPCQENVMLEIHELRVDVGGKAIIKNINMEIPEGETHILFGPNGSGKTTLMMTIMGFSGYKVAHGKIVFKGKDITYSPINERADMGIGVSFQRPPTINGLKTRTLVDICNKTGEADVELLASRLNFSDFLERDVNHNLSGGEIKRSELLQLLAQQPDLVLLDEPESGVDLENITLLGTPSAGFLSADWPAPTTGPTASLWKIARVPPSSLPIRAIFWTISRRTRESCFPRAWYVVPEIQGKF